jgi:hypothetical protein
MIVARASPAFALRASAHSARSPRRSAQTSSSHDLKTSFILYACLSRAFTLMAKSWRKAENTTPGEIADFFSPQEKIQASS